MTRSTVFDTFTIERTFDTAPARVFAAWAPPDAKARWFAGPHEQWKLLERSQDFRVGGRERVRGAFASGTVSTFDAHYFEIVEGERIVYGYDMHVDDRRISVSLATIEILAAGKGTRLVITEQGVFLDGRDDPATRKHGTELLLDQLGETLRSS